MRRFLWAAVLLPVLLAGPASAQTSATIVAGQQIGGVRLGASVADAAAVLGNLYDSADADSGKYTFHLWPLRSFLVITEKESGRIVLVVVNLSDAYRTDKGNITGGSERSAVEAAYGREYTTEDDASTTTVIFDAQGIAFDIGKRGALSGRVTQIIVFTPGQWKTITAGL
ncbi:MAG TPA: hypothetical protein VNN19_02605 [bacterium]|nr:hypothetical protein [bacterium]